MKTKTTLILLCFVVALQINAQIITVDNSPGAVAQWNDLQDAINNAPNNATIYVHASETNYGDIIIDKPLTLIGYSHSDADKKTLIDEIEVLDNASDTKISGFFITNQIDFNNVNDISDVVIENNFFDLNAQIYAGGINSGGFVNNAIIRGNVLERLGSTTGNNNFTNLIISNNIIKSNVYIKFHGTTTIENNIIVKLARIFNIDSSTGDLEVQDSIFYTDNISSWNPNTNGVVFNNCITFSENASVTVLQGSNNINNTNPQFVNVSDDDFDPAFDYNLQNSSPAKGSGVAGDDMGIYSTNTNFVFNNFGFTNGIPAVTITAITSQVAPGANVQVTIQTQAN
jgi:hypothetical protein